MHNIPDYHHRVSLSFEESAYEELEVQYIDIEPPQREILQLP